MVEKSVEIKDLNELNKVTKVKPKRLPKGQRTHARRLKQEARNPSPVKSQQPVEALSKLIADRNIFKGEGKREEGGQIGLDFRYCRFKALFEYGSKQGFISVFVVEKINSIRKGVV